MNAKRLKGKLQKMGDLIKIPVTLRPCELSEVADGSNAIFSVPKYPCVFCDGLFLAMDFVTAPCECAYHPWCITVMQVRLEGRCAQRTCEKDFPMEWLRSFGISKLECKFTVLHLAVCDKILDFAKMFTVLQ